MVNRLKPHAAIEGIEFEVHVIDAPDLKRILFCQGEIIVVYTGLIDQAEKPRAGRRGDRARNVPCNTPSRDGTNQPIARNLGRGDAANWRCGWIDGCRRGFIPVRRRQ